MLVNMKEMLMEARKNKMAIAAINTPSFDIVRAVVDAAEELNTPVILDHASAHEDAIAMEVIGPFMVACAKKAKENKTVFFTRHHLAPVPQLK